MIIAYFITNKEQLWTNLEENDLAELAYVVYNIQSEL
jgi:hypothetical protein